MARRTRRTHSAAFKAKVVLAAIKSENTLAELAKQYGVPTRSPPGRGSWLTRRLFGAAGNAAEAAPAVDVKALHAKIGELTLEADFLASALGKTGLLSAKR